MLSGVKDEVVPREHMEGLWELIAQRDAKHAAGTAAVSVSSTLRRRNRNDSNSTNLARVTDDVTVEDVTGQAEVKFAAYDPRSLSKFIEFENGMHSEPFLTQFGDVDLTSKPDDTCVQPGYWAAIAEFIGNLQVANPAY